MADNYAIVTQYETVEFLGGTRTRDVIAVGVRTAAHGVYFEFRVPKATYTAAIATQNANGFAIVYEDLFQIAGVDGVEWTQEPTPAGQLEDHVIVYVQSSSGNSSSSINVPYSQFAQELIAPKVAALVAQLDAAEAA